MRRQDGPLGLVGTRRDLRRNTPAPGFEESAFLPEAAERSEPVNPPPTSSASSKVAGRRMGACKRCLQMQWEGGLFWFPGRPMPRKNWPQAGDLGV